MRRHICRKRSTCARLRRYAFVVQMTVLPFHQMYADSGDFRWQDRVVYSIKQCAPC